MSRRIIIVLAALLIVVGGSLAVVLAVHRSPKLQNAVYKVTNSTPPTNTNATTNTKTAAPTASADSQAIVFTARNFTETYGSFSNQNSGSNLIEAEANATDSYRTDLQTQATIAQTAPPAKEYLGTVTKALVFTVIKQTATVAQLVVTTQQAVTKGASAKSQTKDLLVDLVKVNGAWKVNAAVWK